MLLDNIAKRGTSWAQRINQQLDTLFGAEYQVKSKENIKEIVQASDIKGAMNQGITLLLNSKATIELLTNNPLDRFTDDKSEKLQLHHIFPRDWCRNNKGTQPIIEELSESHYANLIPLTAASNIKWKASSPARAIKSFGLDFNSHSDTFESGYIDSDCFEYLKNDDLKNFLTRRADIIADDRYKLQFVN